MCRQTRSSSRYTSYKLKSNFLLIQVDINFVMLLPLIFRITLISLLTLYAETFKLLIELIEAMKYNNGCKS